MAKRMHITGVRAEQLIEPVGGKSFIGQLVRRRANLAPFIPSPPAGKRWQDGKLVTRHSK